MFNLGTTPLSAQPGLTTKLHSKAPGNHSGLSQGWGGVGEVGRWAKRTLLLVFPLNFFKYKKRLYNPFLWMGFNCLKTVDPILGDSVLLNTKFPEVSGTNSIDLGRMKD